MEKIKLIIILIILIISCTPTRLTREKEYEIKKNDHGFIEFNFSDDALADESKYNFWGDKKVVNKIWHLNLIINNELLFNGFFPSNQNKYLIPVKAGNINMKYRLRSECRSKGGDYYVFLSNKTEWSWVTSQYKILKLNIEKEKIIKLKIASVSDLKWMVGCVGEFMFGLPMRKKLQEVSFEVESVKDIKDLSEEEKSELYK